MTDSHAIAEANRSTVRAAFEAWKSGSAPITDVFAPEMTWRIEGHSLASKAYASKQEFIDEVLAPFAERFSTAHPFRPTRIHSVSADGDLVIVLWDGQGVTVDGETYANTYAWFMRLAEARVVDGTAFYDSISFNDLWTRVQPEAHEPPIVVKRVAPVLPVRDVAGALARYQRLGFHTRPYIEAGISSAEEPIYGYLTWGGVEIHLSGFDALDPKTNPSVCYLFVADADAVHTSWSAAGVDGRLNAPVDTSYGKREFGYVDPDGNLLRVGSPLQR